MDQSTRELIAAVRGALLRFTPAPTLLVAAEPDAAVSGVPPLVVARPAPADVATAAPAGPGTLPSPAALAAAIEAHHDEHGSLPRRVSIQDGPDLVVGSTLADAAERASEALPDEAVASGRDGVVVGRVAVVTGGAQGFGEQIVRMLVEAGALVVIADLNLDGARALSSELNASHGPVTAAARVDVSDEASVESMVDEVVARAGGIDLFVSNAGVLKAGGVRDLALDDFEFVTRVNYRGFFLCTKHASRVMTAQNATAPPDRFTDIVQINSKSGLRGSNRNGAYAGGKFGGIGLVQSFALELVADRIKVNAICPGNFFEGPLWSDPDRGLFVQYLNAGKVPGAQTIADVKAHYEAQVPMGRGCRGEDVVRALLYVVEQRYETGQAIPVTGGQIMLS